MTLIGAILLALGCRAAAAPVATWRADHHVHLASADLCGRIGECLETNTPSAVYARDAVKALDDGHVTKGVVLSCAYLYGLASLSLDSAAVARFARRENEFTAAEVAKYPDRLVGFLSVDPLQPSALGEIAHWSGSTTLRGLKLHLTANAVDLDNPAHRARVVAVLEAAARAHLPIVMHIGGGTMDSAGAERFIATVLPSAGDSWVQIAHAAGGLPLSGGNHTAILGAFAAHIERDDSATRHVLFDLSYVPAPEEDAVAAAGLTREIRRIGLARFLFGSDFNVITPVTAEAWLDRLHLTAEELATIRDNCAPWAC
jgi:predicted TIM-barrel fold metal-dependent hydrolase